MNTNPKLAAYRHRRIQRDECLWGKRHPGPLRPSGLCEGCHQKNLKRVQQRQGTKP